MLSARFRADVKQLFVFHDGTSGLVPKLLTQLLAVDPRTEDINARSFVDKSISLLCLKNSASVHNNPIEPQKFVQLLSSPPSYQPPTITSKEIPSSATNIIALQGKNKRICE